MSCKLSTIGFIVAVAMAPALAFAQTAPAAKPAVAADAKSSKPAQTGEAACAIHKKDSKEFKDCVAKTKTTQATTAKDPVKKTN
jgi:hypothetical protein